MSWLTFLWHLVYITFSTDVYQWQLRIFAIQCPGHTEVSGVISVEKDWFIDRHTEMELSPLCSPTVILWAAQWSFKKLQRNEVNICVLDIIMVSPIQRQTTLHPYTIYWYCSWQAPNNNICQATACSWDIDLANILNTISIVIKQQNCTYWQLIKPRHSQHITPKHKLTFLIWEVHFMFEICW
jgi:hypothetical protein